MTKKKIRAVSSKLFFENGIANVRLQQIADEANISVGNLAYHYKNKEAIVSAIYEEVFVEMNKLLDGMISKQNLTDFDNSIEGIFRFNNQYNFCFNNLWEIARNYPQLQLQWLAINENMFSLLYKRINHYVKQGLFNTEPYKSAYKILSQQVLLNLLFWTTNQHLKGKKPSLQLFRKNIWSLIIPYLTSKGISEFKKLGPVDLIK
jgi:AcrR family transcriptional regulator